MPPRHTYWTILFGDKPTAFRAATQEELLPTFKQIQSKHHDAVMMWFARGKLWRSEEEARATFDRPKTPFRGPKPDWRDKPRSDRPPGEWKDKPEWQNRRPKPEWRGKPRADRPPTSPPFPRKPAGPGYGGASPKQGDRPDGRDRPRSERQDRPRFDRPPAPKPAWRDKPRGDRQDKPRFDRPRGPKPEWQNRGPKPEWRDKPQGDRQDKPRFDRPRGPKPEWQNRGPKPDRPLRPQGEGPPDDRRGRDWRPGGAHKDPRDRFKVPRDVKRARFKQKLRRERTDPRPPRKKKDEE